MKRKKKMNRRFLALFLALTLCVGSVQMTALADGVDENIPQAAEEAEVPDTGNFENTGTPETIIPEGDADKGGVPGAGTEAGTVDTVLPGENEDVPGKLPGTDTGNTPESTVPESPEEPKTDAPLTPDTGNQKEPIVKPDEILPEESIVNPDGELVDGAIVNPDEELLDEPLDEPGEEIPEVVRQFLELVAAMEAFELTEDNQQEYADLGAQAMEAYDAVVEAGFEEYEGVQEALAVLMEIADRVTGGAETIADKYTVTYHSGSEASGVKNMPENYSSSTPANYEIPNQIPTCENGYYFTGWNKDGDLWLPGDGMMVSDWSPSNDLYAVWVKARECEVEATISGLPESKRKELSVRIEYTSTIPYGREKGSNTFYPSGDSMLCKGYLGKCGVQEWAALVDLDINADIDGYTYEVKNIDIVGGESSVSTEGNKISCELNQPSAKISFEIVYDRIALADTDLEDLNLNVKTQCVTEKDKNPVENYGKLNADSNNIGFTLGEVEKYKGNSLYSYTCELTLEGKGEYWLEKHNEKHPNHKLASEEKLPSVTLYYNASQKKWELPENLNPDIVVENGSYYLTVYVDEHTLTYDGNADGANVDNLPNPVKGIDVQVSSQEPKREGWEFLGWSKDKDAAAPDSGYEAGSNPTATMTLTKDEILYAIWEEETPEPPTEPTDLELKVKTRCLNEGKGGEKDYGKLEGDAHEDGYTLGKVKENQGDNKDTYPYICELKLVKDYWLAAHDKGEAYPYHKLAEGQKIPGAVFYYNADAKKWELVTADGLNPYVGIDPEDGSPYLEVLVAEHTLTYDGNAEDAKDVPSKQEGIRVTVSNGVPTREEGYEFLGWSEDKNAEQPDVQYKAGEKITLKSDLTLYAVWKKDEPGDTPPTEPEEPPVTPPTEPEEPPVTPPTEPEEPPVTPPTEPEEPPVTPPTEPEEPPVTPPTEPEEPPVTPPTEPEEPSVTPSTEPEEPSVTPPTEPEEPPVTPPTQPENPGTDTPPASTPIETIPVLQEVPEQVDEESPSTVVIIDEDTPRVYRRMRDEETEEYVYEQDEDTPVITELPEEVDEESPDTVILMDEDTPQAYVKVQDTESDDYVYLPEEDVPLAATATPQTGDMSSTVLWAVLCLLSTGGMAALYPYKRRRKVS